MPLSTIPLEMGPLSFARGRDVPSLLVDVPFDKVGTSYDAAVARRLKQRGVPVESSAYVVGEVSFHAAQCFRTAGRNRTSMPRRALATTYLSDGVRIVPDLTMISGARALNPVLVVRCFGGRGRAPRT